MCVGCGYEKKWENECINECVWMGVCGNGKGSGQKVCGYVHETANSSSFLCYNT